LAREGGWKAAGPDGAVALAYIALARKDTAAAGRALGGALKHPLAAHLRARAEAPGGPAAGRRPGPRPAARKEPKPDPGPTRGLVGWWKFDDATGTVARDSSGSGNDGSISGARRVRGRLGRALDFDGTSSRVDVPGLGTLAAATLAVWVNIDAVPQSFDALFDTDQWKGGSLHFAFESSGAPTFHVNGYGAAKSSTAFTTADIGRWVHIAVTYDSTTGAMSSYRDGRPDGNHAVARGCALDLGGTGSNIGSWNTGRYFDGKLDDFRVYARVLSPAEVGTLAAVR
ncbi:MAG: LamG domain-containing protein, partial [Planctomycetota bacterium]